MPILTDAEKDQDLYKAAKAGIVDAARYVAYFTDKAVRSTDQASSKQYMKYAAELNGTSTIPVDDYIEHTLKPVLCENAKQQLKALAHLPHFKLYLMRLCTKGYIKPEAGYLHLQKDLLSLRRFITLWRYLYDRYIMFRWPFFETLFDLPLYTMSKNNTHINPNTKSFEKFIRSLFE